MLALHVLMYYIGFVPDALEAESLVREVAADIDAAETGS
jgi:hypothetical protein